MNILEAKHILISTGYKLNKRLNENLEDDEEILEVSDEVEDPDYFENFIKYTDPEENLESEYEVEEDSELPESDDISYTDPSLSLDDELSNEEIEAIEDEKELSPEKYIKLQNSIKEAKKIVNENGYRFIKSSKRYAGNHPVFSGKHFQEYLLKECGTDCLDGDCEDKNEGAIDFNYELEDALKEKGLTDKEISKIMTDNADFITKYQKQGKCPKKLAKILS